MKKKSIITAITVASLALSSCGNLTERSREFGENFSTMETARRNQNTREGGTSSTFTNRTQLLADAGFRSSCAAESEFGAIIARCAGGLDAYERNELGQRQTDRPFETHRKKHEADAIEIMVSRHAKGKDQQDSLRARLQTFMNDPILSINRLSHDPKAREEMLRARENAIQSHGFSKEFVSELRDLIYLEHARCIINTINKLLPDDQQRITDGGRINQMPNGRIMSLHLQIRRAEEGKPDIDGIPWRFDEIEPGSRASFITMGHREKECATKGSVRLSWIERSQ